MAASAILPSGQRLDREIARVIEELYTLFEFAVRHTRHIRTAGFGGVWSRSAVSPVIPRSGIGYVSRAGNHPDIAERLATTAELYEKGSCSADFASFIAQIRQD